LGGYLFTAKNIKAQTPTFPLCENQTQNGDRAHYDTGLHQIAGGGLLEGKDDVYGLGNSYYFQCFCSPEGDGIQTNWTPVKEGQEWGPNWNLDETYYNYENRDFNCGRVIPTPTPTFSQERCNNCGGGSAPVCNDTVPSTPRILSVVSAGINSIKITWTKVTQANSYSILYGKKTGEYPYSVFSTGNTDNFVINGISSGCFEVKAVNGCMPGPLSPEFCSGSVLGTSTLADTGLFSDSINNVVLVFGLLLTGLGLMKFVKHPFKKGVIKLSLLMGCALTLIGLTAYFVSSNKVQAQTDGWEDVGVCIADGCGTTEGYQRQERATVESADPICPANYDVQNSGNWNQRCHRIENCDWYSDQDLDCPDEHTTPTGCPTDFTQDGANCTKPAIESQNVPCNDAEVITCETTITPTPTCALVCEWSTWSDCNVTCGGGHQYRYLRGEGCSNEEESRDCNEQACEGPTLTPTPTNVPETPRGGNGPASAPVCNNTVPAAPRILSANSIGGNSVKVIWTKVTPADSYTILYGTKSGDYPYSVFSTGDTDNYVINGISAGCFAIKASNGCMPGPLSSELCTGGVGGQVLGASTLGTTGAFTDSISNLVMAMGLILSGLGLIKLPSKRI
jgi:hypothetical protein